jgi:magnesium-transporting ATPase (P-type)
MTEEPKQKARGAQGTEQKDNNWVNRVKEFFLDNPTLLLSLLYFYVTGTGIFYAYYLYLLFDINIFDYATIVDFLLAAFKSPRIFLLVAGQLALIILLYFVYLMLWKFSERLFFRIAMWMMVAMGFLLFFIGPYNYAIRSAVDIAQSIKHGKQPSVEVRYISSAGSADQVTEPGLELIGTTQRVFFFYDVKDQRTLVIPQSQIISIAVPE